MSIDTLAFANELKAAGVPDQAAEAQARALNKAVQGGLATKVDLQVMEERLYSRMLAYLAVQALAVIALNATVVGILLRLMR